VRLPAREWKATAIEQALVEMGHKTVPDDAGERQAACERAGYKGASDDTWDRVTEFLTDRFRS